MTRLTHGVLLLLVPISACGPTGLREREVRFTNGAITLAGTVVLPEGSGPHPGIVIVHGSGPETRDMYLRYAREYAKAGIAALAWDKRGSGASTDANARAPYDTLAADVLAAVDVLRREPGVDSLRIGLFGLSEGEWVAPLAASRMQKPAFLVLASASSLTPAMQVRAEIGRRLEAKGYPDSIVSRAQSLYERVSQFQRDGSGRPELNAALDTASAQPWFEDANYLDRRVPEYSRVQALEWFPVWRANMDFDALELIERLDCPVLVLLGGRDLKNDAAQASARYAEAVGRKPGRAFASRIFPDAEHAMVEWWLPFRLPPPRYPDGYFEYQTAWVKQQLIGRT